MLTPPKTWLIYIPPPFPSSLSKIPNSELGLGRLESRHQQVAYVAGRLVDIEAHLLAAEALGHNIEAETACIVSLRRLGMRTRRSMTYLFSLIM